MEQLKNNVNAWGQTPQDVERERKQALIDYERRVDKAWSEYGIRADVFRGICKLDKALQNWFMLVTNGAIQHDEATGKTYQCWSGIDAKFEVEDCEKQIVEAVTKSIKEANQLNKLFIQDDCRGSSLYIYRDENLPKDSKIDCIYSSFALTCCDPKEYMDD